MMGATPPPTDGDIYVTICFTAAVFTIALTVGWVIDGCAEWRRRHEEFAMWANYRQARQANDAYAYPLPGTVDCPTDPSPTPRRPRR